MSNRGDRLKLELKRARGPFLVVLVLAVCAVVVTTVILASESFKRPWADYVTVRGSFDDVKGVLPGQQDVRIAGVKVGVITGAKLQDGKAVLTLSIEHRYAPIYRDAELRLRPKTPLQDMYVDVKRGTPKAGKLDAKTILSADQTEAPVDVSQVVQTFDADTRTRLQALLNGFGQGLADRGADLRAAFVQIAPLLTAASTVTHELAVRKTRLKRMVSETARLTQALGARDQALTSLVRSGNATLATLARSDVPLGPTITELPPTLDALQTSLTALGRAQDQLDPALVALDPTVKKLPAALDALDRLAGDLTPAARKLQPAITALLPLARTLRPTAKSLASAVVALRPQVQDADIATTKVSGCETVLRHFFTWTLSVFKFSDVYGTIPRGDVSVGADSTGASNLGLTRRPTCTGSVR